MIKQGPIFRSRRRRSSFALFGRHVQRAEVQPFPDRVWAEVDRVSEAIADQHQRETRPSRNDDQELAEAIRRVQQDARVDRILANQLPEQELDHVIEGIVRDLWANSRVTTFVPLIALRQARATLGPPAGETEDIPMGVEA